MPQLKAHLRTRYSHVDGLLNRLAKRVKGKPKVLRSYQQYTGLDRSRAILSLQPTGHVLTEIQDSAMPKLRPVPEIDVSTAIAGYAKYPGIGKVIHLRKEFAEDYQALMSSDPFSGFDPHGKALEERGHPVPSGVRDPHGRMIYEPAPETLDDEKEQAERLMESKILHEMVHWARTMITFLPDPQSGPQEKGWQFEQAAYGKELTAFELKIRHYISVPGNM